MEKSIENIMELGVNLLIAAAALFVFLYVIGIGRDFAVTMENEKRAKTRTEKQVEFGELNGKIVDYGAAIELVTYYAGELDLYVDSTADGGAVLISSKQYTGKENWTTVKANVTYPVTATAKRVWLDNASTYASVEKYMREAAKLLLKSDLTAKFGSGKWRVDVIINGGYVGTAPGVTPGIPDEITGIRLTRIS